MLMHCVRSGRILFLACLLVSALTLAFVTHSLLEGAEDELVVSQFDSIADRALVEAQAATRRCSMGARSLASIIGHRYPNKSSDWPFVLLDGYNEIAQNILQTGSYSGGTLVFAPIVQPNEAGAFEERAYEYLEANHPPGAGIGPFGKGIIGISQNRDGTVQPYHDTTGETAYGSAHQILTPHIQIEGKAFFMVNAHASPFAGPAMDQILSCVDSATTRDQQCAAMSHPHQLYDTDISIEGPGSIIIHPILPARDNTSQVAGFIMSSVMWRDVIGGLFNSEVSGMDCVLSVGTQKFRYTVNKGVPRFSGVISPEQERGFGRLIKSVSLTENVGLNDRSPTLTLTIYATDEFSEGYRTTHPVYAAIGAVGIIVFTSLFFFLYDFCVRKEFYETQAVLEAKRRFIRFISHEVRTPLNSVCMGIKVLKEDLVAMSLKAPGSGHHEGSTPNSSFSCSTQGNRAATEALTLAGEILASANSAVDVLNDLLNYDKIESGQLKLEMSIVAIQSFLEGSMREFQLPFRSKDIESSIEMDEGFPLVEGQSLVCDPVRLSQVMRNLLSNALKFTPQGGNVRLHVRWQGMHDTTVQTDEMRLEGCDQKVSLRRGGMLTVEVSDDGAGMTSEQLNGLFTMGVQFNVNRLQAGQGSGLGLYIAKGIVLQHGGNLMASSEGLGKGCTFSLSLPTYDVSGSAYLSCHDEAHTQRHEVSANQASTKVLENNSPRTSTTQISQDSRRILVVDDASMNRKLLSRLLQKRGHTCEEAADGAEAVERVRTELEKGLEYDTILMDFEMPTMDGPTASGKIREMGCQCPIVGITGNVLPEDVRLFKSKGANEVLPKPLDLHVLEAFWMERGL